jgi:hypothetical protein
MYTYRRLKTTTQRVKKTRLTIYLASLTYKCSFNTAKEENKAFKRLQEKIIKHNRQLANLQSTNPYLNKKRIEKAKGRLLTDTYR